MDSNHQPPAYQASALTSCAIRLFETKGIEPLLVDPKSTALPLGDVSPIIRSWSWTNDQRIFSPLLFRWATRILSTLRLELRTNGLKVRCSTNWAMHPNRLDRARTCNLTVMSGSFYQLNYQPASYYPRRDLNAQACEPKSHVSTIPLRRRCRYLLPELNRHS